MENLSDREGGSVGCRALAASTDLRDELVTSLTSFLNLYDQHRDRLQATLESLALKVAQLHDMLKGVSELTRCLFAMIGGVLGAARGGVCGGVLGSLGAIGATTWGRYCGNISTIGATLGFVGSVFGGVAGGVSGGAVGSALGAADEARGSLVHNVVNNAVWFTIGFTTGGAVGGIFGGTVGATGGAMGGAFAALYATRFSAAVLGGPSTRSCKIKDSKELKTTSKRDVIQEITDFSEAIKPLVDELRTIQRISNLMASSGALQGVAEQTAKTLASVSTMEEIIDCQRVAELSRYISCVEDAVSQSKKIAEELETTRAEVKELLVLLKKPLTTNQELDETPNHH